MVENGPAGASEASVDIDSYKAAAILALLLVAIFAVGFPLIIDALRLRRDTSATAPPTGAIGAGDYARTLQQAAELVGGEALAAQKRSLPCTIALVVGQACSFTTSRFGDEVPYGLTTRCVHSWKGYVRQPLF